jgi:hypothetical protein
MASATLHAMLWPRMPAGERIAAWVTWNLFLFLAATEELAQNRARREAVLGLFRGARRTFCALTQLPNQRRRVSLHVILAVFLQSLHQRIHHRSLIARLQAFDESGGQQIAGG